MSGKKMSYLTTDGRDARAARPTGQDGENPPGVAQAATQGTADVRNQQSRETQVDNPWKCGFDVQHYLLQKYGLRMNKKEVEFELKRKRATIDNMRNPRHRSYNPELAAAQEEPLDRSTAGASPVLFKTVLIARMFNSG